MHLAKSTNQKAFGSFLPMERSNTMETQVFENYAEFKKREDKSINGVSPGFAKANPNHVEENHTNIGCWNCSLCIGCQECFNCRECDGCTKCSNSKGCSNCDGGAYWKWQFNRVAEKKTKEKAKGPLSVIFNKIFNRFKLWNTTN